MHPFRPNVLFAHLVAGRPAFAAENAFALRRALPFACFACHKGAVMKQPETDDKRTSEEAERIAREAIRRSFELPYKPQKEMVGKTPRARDRKARPAKSPPKAR
jgi:hypothetical protein